jgi:hypothetical protein
LSIAEGTSIIIPLFSLLKKLSFSVRKWLCFRVCKLLIGLCLGK